MGIFNGLKSIYPFCINLSKTNKQTNAVLTITPENLFDTPCTLIRTRVTFPAFPTSMFAPSTVTRCPGGPFPPSLIWESMSVNDLNICSRSYSRNGNGQRWSRYTFLFVTASRFYWVTKTVVSIFRGHWICTWSVALSCSTTTRCRAFAPVCPTVPTSIDCKITHYKLVTFL